MDKASSLPDPSPIPLIHIIRHGQSQHNIDRNYPHRDPALTDFGHAASKQITILAVPDLILISPMTRTIQSAMNAFPSISSAPHLPNVPKVQIWPELREAHDAICNQGISRADLSTKFPQLNFAECSPEWDYPLHTAETATIRAEKVRARLQKLAKVYDNIVVVTHRGFIAFLIKGDRFDVCETRSNRFGTNEEMEADSLRYGVNVDTMTRQDFGPTILIPHSPQGS